jgi:hypothetical protein
MSNPAHDHTFLCSELVSVLYETQAGRTRSAIANIEEISASSATLLSDERLPEGKPVAFAAKGHTLQGTVECIEKDEMLGYFAKVKFDPASRWQGRLFIPEHFLALCACAREAGGNGKAALPTRAFALAGR